MSCFSLVNAIIILVIFLQVSSLVYTEFVYVEKYLI